jgi:hypothetical protein
MARDLGRQGIAGVMCLLVGSLVLASERSTHSGPPARAGTCVTFFPFPPVVCIAARPSRAYGRPYFHLDRNIDFRGAYMTPTDGSSFRADFRPPDWQHQQATGAYAVQSGDTLPGDLTGQEDEWHFYANPQLGVNHEHEKGMTFSVRHGF